MDRLRLETVYLRALDALMSALLTQCQIQAADIPPAPGQSSLARVGSAGVSNNPLTQEESLPPGSLITALYASP